MSDLFVPDSEYAPYDVHVYADGRALVEGIEVPAPPERGFAGTRAEWVGLYLADHSGLDTRDILFIEDQIAHWCAPATLGDVLALHPESSLEPDPPTLAALLQRIRSVPRVGTLEDSQYPLLNRVDLGEVMRGGATAPEMLLEGRRVQGKPHLDYGAKESGKTWLVLRDCAELLRRGETVIWIDKEMDRQSLADMLVALKVPDDVVSERFVYLDRPTLDMDDEPLRQYLALLLDVRPALVVVDAAQGALASADLNEDRSADVIKWHTRYLEPALLLGGTTVVIDHTGHDEGGRARGASGKGQIARVEWLVEKVSPFDRDAAGVVRTTLRKNTPAAPLPKVQHWRIGGTPFVLEPDAMPPVPEGEGGETARRIRMRVLELLRSEPDMRFSKTQVTDRVTGTGTIIRQQLVSLAEEDGSRVRSANRGQSVVYWYEQEPADTNGAPSSEGVLPYPPSPTDGVSLDDRRGADGADGVANDPSADAGLTPSADTTAPDGVADMSTDTDTTGSTRVTRRVRAEQAAERARAMVAQGASFEQIAEELGVTERTVRRYLA